MSNIPLLRQNAGLTGCALECAAGLLGILAVDGGSAGQFGLIAERAVVVLGPFVFEQPGRLGGIGNIVLDRPALTEPDGHWRTEPTTHDDTLVTQDAIQRLFGESVA